MAAPAAVQAFVKAAKGFSAAASAAASSGGVDPSVLLSLNGLPDLCAAAINSLRVASSAPEVAGAVSACELLLFRCAQLGDSLLAQAPPLGAWIAPTDMPLVVIAERFYGADALARLPEILANNPHVLGLVLVPAGTALKLAQATV